MSTKIKEQCVNEVPEEDAAFPLSIDQRVTKQKEFCVFGCNEACEDGDFLKRIYWELVAIRKILESSQ